MSAGTRFVAPVPGYLVVHPKGKLLFDTGVDCRAADDPVGRLGKRLSAAFQMAGAPDEHVAGQLAAMGLTALLGVFAAGAISDRLGPAWPTAVSFVARILAFGLLMLDQSAISIAIFALVFGATFLVTAPLTILFVSGNFGLRHLGALSGLITLVHHICGAAGAYLGSAVFDTTGSYDVVFPIMLGSSMLALLLTWPLRHPARV